MRDPLPAEGHHLKEAGHLSAFWDKDKCDDEHPLPRAYPETRIGGRGVGNAREKEHDRDGRPEVRSYRKWRWGQRGWGDGNRFSVAGLCIMRHIH
jgi:hypothetical protein